jgi:hypothetical protein
MAITPATAFGTQMTKLTGNTGGAVQNLIESYVNGIERAFVETVTYAAQVAGTVIGIARINVPCTLLGFTLLASVSSGSTTLALGNAANGNSAIYKAAAAFTTTDTPTRVGLSATMGAAILSGIDSQGLPTTYGSAQNGGGGYEDITLTLAAATAPGAGTLRIWTHYLLP